MSDYPRLRALLVEMLALGETDLQLPLSVIINLHRPQLRTPLENLARVAGDAWLTHDDHLDLALLEVLNYVDRHWPALVGGKLWRTGSGLDALTRITDMYEPQERIVWEPKTEHEQVVLHLIDAAFQDWRNYDPLYALHHLATAGSATRDALCELLEIELGMDPDTRELILAHAEKA